MFCSLSRESFFSSQITWCKKQPKPRNSVPPTPWVNPLFRALLRYPPWVRRDRNQRSPWISSLRRWMALIFTRCALRVRWSAFDDSNTLQGTDTYPTLEFGKSSTQNAIFGGYVNSLEGTGADNGFILRHCRPILRQKETWKEEEEEEIVRGDIHLRSLT